VDTNYPWTLWSFFK